MAKLQDFMISRVRSKLYKVFFSNPQEMFYVRQLTRETREEINAIRRELSRMEEKGVIKSEERGNRLYYYTNNQYDFYEDMLSLVVKTTNLGLEIRKNRKKLGKIKFAMFSGKFVKHLNRLDDEVDILIVGDIVIPEITQLIQAEETRRKIEINYTTMTQDEFIFRKSRRDPFLLSILSQSRIMIIGDEEGLVDKSKGENA